MVIHSLLPISLETMHDPKDPVLLIALKIMQQCYVVSFGDHVPYLRVSAPRRMCRALSTYGQRGQV
jgi:hypothetical protein